MALTRSFFLGTLLMSILISVRESLLKLTWDLTISGASTSAYDKKENTNSKKASKLICIKMKKVKTRVVSYSVLVNDVDDDDELAIFLAVVDESNPSDLDVPLERLKTKRRKRSLVRLEH